MTEETKREEILKEEQTVKEVEDSVKASGGKKKKEINYETTVVLPSKGLLYKGEIPAEITMRGMTTKEEKIMYASQGGDVFKKILKSCIIEPRNIDINRLTASDESFLILQLRMITYGDKYKVSVVCPHCGTRDEYEINLSDFDVNYLEDTFEEPIDVELPRSGDIVSIRLLRNEDDEFITKYARKFSRQFNLDYREVEYVCRLARYIVKINDEEVDFIKARDYVEKMPSLDTAKIRTVLRKIDFGLDTMATVTCRTCGDEFDFDMPMTSEFFRPTVE